MDRGDATEGPAGHLLVGTDISKRDPIECGFDQVDFDFHEVLRGDFFIFTAGKLR